MDVEYSCQHRLSQAKWNSLHLYLNEITAGLKWFLIVLYNITGEQLLNDITQGISSANGGTSTYYIVNFIHFT